MNAVVLALKVLLFLFLGYLLGFLVARYHPELAGFHPPFALFVLDTINLFIHEAGHFFFRIFGFWMHMLAGSLFQVLVPLALVVVSWRQNIATVPYGGFWMGESLVNVSAYIRDAPYKQLRLIAKGLVHDWNWLLSENLEAAEPIADIVFWTGILICTASITAGFYFAIRLYREDLLKPGEE